MSSSSVITQAVQGLATATSPGLVGTGAQTFAGKKTLDGGAAIKGDTSGSAIAAGYVGEKITWASAPSDQTITTTESDWTNANIVLTSGVWLVVANIQVYAETAATSGSSQSAIVRITNSSNTIIQNQDKLLYVKTTANVTNGIQTTLPFSFIANLSAASTTYKIRCYITSAGTGTIANRSLQYSEFYGIRIA